MLLVLLLLLSSILKFNTEEMWLLFCTFWDESKAHAFEEWMIKGKTKIVCIKLLTGMMNVNLVIIFIVCTVWTGFIFGMAFNLCQTHPQTVFAIDYVVWCSCGTWNWRHFFVKLFSLEFWFFKCFKMAKQQRFRCGSCQMSCLFSDSTIN